MNRSLQGAAVLVTRPAGQAEELCKLLEQQGAMPVRMPLLAIEKLGAEETGVLAMQKFSIYDWVIFISANAVNFALQTNSGKINTLNLKRVRFAAIGEATAKAMHAWKLPVDLCPDKGSNSEALLASPEFQQLSGLSFLLVRGQGGRELLAETLRQRGARVTYWEVYKRSKPSLNMRKIAAQVEKQRSVALTITSGEALQNLIEISGGKLPEFWLSTPLAVVSERIKRMAELAGFTKIAVSADPSDAAIINTVSVLINGE